MTTAKATLIASGLKEVSPTLNEDGIDPTVLQTIQQIIQTLVTAFTSCKTPAAQAAAIAAKPSPFHKMRVRRAVLASTDQPFYALHGREVVQSILYVGASITEAEMAQMYAEAEQAQV